MVNKNETYTIEITGMSHEGMGIGKVEGFTIFVEGAIIDEIVEVKVVKLEKKYGFGKLIKIIRMSQSRIEPLCEHYNRCGGCNLQHMKYEEQLQFKTQKVKETIERIGKIKDVTIHDTIGMQETMRYRNKAQFPIGMKDNNIVLGFFAPRSHDIVDIDSCIIQDSLSEKLALLVKEFVKNNNIPVYDESHHNGLLRHVVTKVGFKTDEAMLVIVINGDDLPKKDQLIDLLVKRFENIKSIVLSINKDNTNVIMGRNNKIIYGSTTISDYIGEFKFNISAHSFYQVNPVQTEVLYNKALEYAGLKGNETVFDAYCGIGTISLFLSKCAKKVYGIEIVPQAIEDAKVNAKSNSVDNVEFICGESENIIPKLYKEGKKADVIVVDPPRKGCDKKLLDTIIEMKPEKMVYVSCDVGTLARDLRILKDGGYKVREIQPVDMFPYTYHVETCSLLTTEGV